MKLKDKSGAILDAFATYRVNDETFFYVLVPSWIYGGLLQYKFYEVSVVDPSMNFRTVFFQKDHMAGVFHWALIEKNLLNDLLAEDVSAYNSFVSLLKLEGIVSKDFDGERV